MSKKELIRKIQEKGFGLNESTLKTLDVDCLKIVLRATNILSPCPICGMPKGNGRIYCKRCAMDRKREKINKFSMDHYHRVGRIQRIKKKYIKILNDVQPFVPFSNETIMDTVLYVHKSYDLPGWPKDMVLSAVLIYLIRKNRLDYTIKDVASWLNIPSSRANRLWRKLKNEDPFRKVHLDYLKWKTKKSG